MISKYLVLASLFLLAACGLFSKDENNDSYTTPIECVGTDHTYISRIRNDESIENGLNLWVVSDNLRKGAALNTIQIAEILLEEYLN